MLSDILKACGLNESESDVYETLLLHGPSTPAELSKKTSTSRENTYRILDLLAQKGLVIEITDANKLKYSAENPNKLSILLDKRANEIKEATKVAKEISSKIEKELESSKKSPHVDFLQGEEGIKAAYMSSISKGGGIQYEILDKKWDKYFKKWLDKIFIPTRVKMRIQKRVIILHNEDVENVSFKSDKNELKETMSIKSDNFPQGSGIIVHDDKTVLISKGQPNEGNSISIVLNHKIISGAIETILDTLWNLNKKKIK